MMQDYKTSKRMVGNPVRFCSFLSLLSFCLALLGAPRVGEGQKLREPQHPGKVYRIGFLATGSAKPFRVRLNAFRQGLEQLGYVEGKNIVIDERFAEGGRDRLPGLAAELIALDPDVIVVHGGAVALFMDRAVKEAGKDIPIVFAVSGAPVEEGNVGSLARPGGNVTGLSDFHGALAPKRLEFLQRVSPSISRVAALWNPAVPSNVVQLKAFEAVGPSLGLTLLPLKFGSHDDLDRAFAAMKKDRPDALIVFGQALLATGTNRKDIAEFALEKRLPTIGPTAEFVTGGGLLSYGTNLTDLYERSAAYVDKIFKGARPANLPVEQPTQFYLTVNLTTAERLGLAIPPSILYRADNLIRSEGEDH